MSETYWLKKVNIISAKGNHVLLSYFGNKLIDVVRKVTLLRLFAFLALILLSGIYIVGNNSLGFAAAFNFLPPPTSKSPTFTNYNQLQFKPWGPGNLTIVPVANNSFQEFKFSGVTGNNGSGFVSQDLNYTGKQVTISLRNVSKSSASQSDNNTQIFFTFTIAGGGGRASFVTYVVGPLHISGWYKGHLYQGLTPGSVQTINLEGLTSHDIHYLKKIVIAVQKESRINNAEFGVKLG